MAKLEHVAFIHEDRTRTKLIGNMVSKIFLLDLFPQLIIVDLNFCDFFRVVRISRNEGLVLAIINFSTIKYRCSFCFLLVLYCIIFGDVLFLLKSNMEQGRKINIDFGARLINRTPPRLLTVEFSGLFNSFLTGEML